MSTFAMVTGHRVVANDHAVLLKLSWIIRKLEEQGHDEIIGISGGAEGADSLWARACFNEHRPFDLYVPNRYYFKHYRADDHEVEFLTSKARNIITVVTRPAVSRSTWEPRMKARPGNDPWWVDNFERNRAMIKAASVHIAVSDRHPMEYVRDPSIRGGTAGCIRDLHRSVQEILWLCPQTPDTVKRIVFNR